VRETRSITGALRPGKLFGVLLDRARRSSEFETVLVRGYKQPVRSGCTEHGLFPPEFFMEGKVCSISALCAAATTIVKSNSQENTQPCR
jgi:hypothetical protein